MEQNPSNEEPNKDIPHLDATYQHDEKSKEPDDDEFKGYTSSDDLLHKYVIVLYDGMPYPVYVSDIDNDDVFVRCMHRVPGKKIDSCMFYWPKCVLDECWCSLDNVACLIKDPTRVGFKYVVESEKWAKIVQMYAE